MMVSCRRFRKAMLVVATLAPLAGCLVPSDGTVQPETPLGIKGIEGEGSVDVRVSGAVTTLEATPSEGWRFDRWDGPNDTSTENPHNVSTSRVERYTAVFMQQFALTVSVSGGGTVEIDGMASVGPDPVLVDSGSERTLTAMDTNGWCFDGWTGHVTTNGNPLTVVMDEDVALEAEFVQQVRLTARVDGEGIVELDDGEAIGTDPVIVCPGSARSLTAVASNGWCFDAWSGDVTTNADSIPVTIEEDTALTATFMEQIELPVTIVGEGSIDVEGLSGDDDPLLVCPDVEHTLTAVPSNGWRFDTWRGDMTTNGEVITLVINEETVLEAVFVQEHALTLLTLDESGDEFVSTTGFHDAGTEVALEALVPDGWEFDRWMVEQGGTDAIADPTSPSTTVTINRDLTITSIVIDRSRAHTLEILSDGGAEGVPFVEDATQVTLAAIIPDCDFRLAFSQRGYFLACWSDLDDRPASEHAPYGGIPVRNTFFHGEAVTLSATSYVIQAGEATFSGQTAVSRWGGDASSTTDTVKVIMDGDKTVRAIR